MIKRFTELGRSLGLLAVLFLALPSVAAEATEAQAAPKPAAKTSAAKIAPGQSAQPAKPKTSQAQKPASTAKTPAQAKSQAKSQAKPQVSDQTSPLASPLHPAILSEQDRDLGRQAMREASAGRFDKAREIASRAKEPLVGRLVHWLWLQTANSGAPFEQIAQFIETSPDWPSREALLRRADEAITQAVGDARILAWYKAYPPESGLGWLRLAEALERQGRDAEMMAALRRSWSDGNLSLTDETELWREFSSRLTADDNARRLDRLLWEEQYDAARRMLPRVTPEARAIAEARLALGRNIDGAERVADSLPQILQSDGGLAYDRMRWNRRRGKDDIVEALLYAAPDDLGRAEKWWVERHFRARKAMAEGRISEAYRLAAGHGLKAGNSMVEAEWLAGWIALRLLQEPRIAQKHFEALLSSVTTPVSQARAGYWLGRSFEALGDREQARLWYSQASKHATVFYGQLASFALTPSAQLRLPQEAEPSAEAVARFNRRPVVRAAKILVELGQEQRLRPFILRLAHTSESVDEHRLVARLARQLNRVDLAVAATKRSARYGGLAQVQEAFPLVEPMARTRMPETALVLAVARQESEFNQFAVSPAGARGLMQLMPATAKGVAKELKTGYAPAKLTDDAHYNVQLGSHYLQGLLDNWDHNYVLALAGYNAGEARVRRWIKDWGDPRLDGIDPVDWIELIPFSETRNYVQRVLESVQVYRALLGGQAPTTERLLADMRGLQRRACAANVGC